MIGTMHKGKVHNLSYLNEKDSKLLGLLQFDISWVYLKFQCDKERSISSNVRCTNLDK